MSPSEKDRQRWREAQRSYRARASLKKAAARGFEPRIVKFERCSICLEWHPTMALHAGGCTMLTLADYHNAVDIQKILKSFEGLVKGDQGHGDEALNRCIAFRMKNEDEDEDAAKASCEALFEDESARQRWEDAAEQDGFIQTQQEICVHGRMELYKESREIAGINCQLLLDDPIYRHMPPGLIKNIIPPMDIHSDEHVGTEGPDDQNVIENIMTCFYHEMEVEGADPKEAMIFCSRRAQHKFTPEEEKSYEHTIDSTFGLTKEQVLERQRLAKQGEDNLTVGDLFGQSKEERLEQQRRKRLFEKMTLNEREAFIKARRLNRLKSAGSETEEQRLLAEKRRRSLKSLKKVFPEGGS